MEMERLGEHHRDARTGNSWREHQTAGGLDRETASRLARVAGLESGSSHILATRPGQHQSGRLMTCPTAGLVSHGKWYVPFLCGMCGLCGKQHHCLVAPPPHLREVPPHGHFPVVPYPSTCPSRPAPLVRYPPPPNPPPTPSLCSFLFSYVFALLMVGSLSTTACWLALHANAAGAEEYPWGMQEGSICRRSCNNHFPYACVSLTDIQLAPTPRPLPCFPDVHRGQERSVPSPSLAPGTEAQSRLPSSQQEGPLQTSPAKGRQGVRNRWAGGYMRHPHIHFSTSATSIEN